MKEKKEIMDHANPENNTGYADALVGEALARAEDTIKTLRKVYNIIV